VPSYDYRCKECGYAFEEFQSISAEPLVSCPSCGKPALKRLFAGGGGMIFKGSGFYHTDYKKKGTSGSSPSSGNGSPKKESKPTTPPKSDSKKTDS
jgi:putative FmdB family regulatory protein